MKELSDYIVTNKFPQHLIKSPSFLEGEFGKALFQAYEQERDNTYQENLNLRLQYNNGVITGSNFFDNLLINKILKQFNVQGNPRTLLPSDLNNKNLKDMIEGNYYTDSQALVLRSLEDSYNPLNDVLIKHLLDNSDIDASKLEKEPALIHGLDLILNPKKEGYGLLVEPNNNFTVHYDDRFLIKWDDSKFNKVDELGIPIFNDNGTRALYTRKDGLSRLFLGRDLGLDSSWGGLGFSNSYGRVVIFGGEATASKNNK